jgi:hypothetical protein
MHRIKTLLTAGAAALAVTGGAVALAGPASAAATTLTYSLSASGSGASATVNSAGDLVLTVGSPSDSTNAVMTITNAPTTAPSTAPTFATNNYGSGSPRWFIKFKGGDAVYGYPASNSGLGTTNWQVIPGTGSCAGTPSAFVQYSTALTDVPSACGGDVTSAGIIADGGQAAGTSDTITDINYGGMTLTDVVTVAAPSTQTGSVGVAIKTLTIAASSNTGSAINAFAASGLPNGLAISSTTGAITGTPTTAGNYSVTVTATDAAGTSGKGTFNWDIGGGPTGPVPIYTGPIKLYKMGLCLDDRLNSHSNGAVAQVWKCNGESTQTWQVMSNGTIQHDGLCLDAWNYGTGNGTPVQLWACTGAGNQKWDTRGYRVHYDNPKASNKVLDDTAFGKSGTQLEIYNNNGGANQLWETS